MGPNLAAQSDPASHATGSANKVSETHVNLASTHFLEFSASQITSVRLAGQHKSLSLEYQRHRALYSQNVSLLQHVGNIM